MSFLELFFAAMAVMFMIPVVQIVAGLVILCVVGVWESIQTIIEKGRG